MKAKKIETEKWYEIDDCQDLDIASSIFARNTSEKLELFHKRFGGYWRYNDIKDYCYYSSCAKYTKC